MRCRHVCWKYRPTLSSRSCYASFGICLLCCFRWFLGRHTTERCWQTRAAWLPSECRAVVARVVELTAASGVINLFLTTDTQYEFTILVVPTRSCRDASKRMHISRMPSLSLSLSLLCSPVRDGLYNVAYIHIHTLIYIYIYIERERERERERQWSLVVTI